MSGKAGLLALLLAAICPACGVSPDLQAPQGPESAVRSVDVDAPNGVCRLGAEMLPHIGCVDGEMALSVDAIDACRSVGEPECTERCQKGDAPSCTALAMVHQFGLETTSNSTYAASLLDRACAGGDGAGCNNLGVLHAKGLGFPVEEERAEVLYGVACQQGSVLGCANLVRARTWGENPPDNVLQAARTVDRACDSTQDAHACAALALMRSRGSGLPRDEKLAADLFGKACDAGDVESCVRLGVAYRDGDGVALNDLTALQLFRRACDHAHAEACTDLASMYCLGRGVPRDAPRSTALMRQACDAGDAAACRSKACGG